MPTSASSERSGLAPNHHADYPGFVGIGGLAAAATFSVGRGADADLAVGLTGAGPGDDVVDVGCGPGVAVRRAAVAGAASVVGVDPATVMLRTARTLTALRRRRSAGVSFVRGAAEALPLPDESATVLWSLATVHHWRDLDRGLAEFRRVLRPHGRLLAIERHVDAGAVGHASHGWVSDQAHSFAERCGAAGFVNVQVGAQRSRRRRVLYVLAEAP